MPTNARAFFDDFLNKSDRYAFLAGLVTTPPSVFETEWLDFKGNPQPKDVLKTWSEAVSGFANTEGGVLIWGIDCRKVGTVDAASGLSLIGNPLALKSQLHTNINQTTDPPVQGIEVEVVEGTGGQGFVVCFVPESTNKPHRAEQKTNKPYMIRCGDSFVVPSPSLLRSMFYPKVSPDLRIEVQAASGEKLPIVWEQPRTPPYAAFIVTISNQGNVSAEDLFVVCTSKKKQGIWVVIDKEWTAKTVMEGFGISASTILHPGMRSRFALFDPGASKITKQGLREVSLTKFTLSFMVFGRDIEAKQFSVSFEKTEIEGRMTKQAANA
jgi:hypothetical protein